MFSSEFESVVFLTAFIEKLCPPVSPCNHKRLLPISLLPSWASHQSFLAFPTSLSPFPVSLCCTKPTLTNSPETQDWITELLRLKTPLRSWSSRLYEDILNGLIVLLNTTGRGPHLVWESGLLKGLLYSLLYNMWIFQWTGRMVFWLKPPGDQDSASSSARFLCGFGKDILCHNSPSAN